MKCWKWILQSQSSILALHHHPFFFSDSLSFRNEIGGKGAISIFESLKVNSSLVSLGLRCLSFVFLFFQILFSIHRYKHWSKRRKDACWSTECEFISHFYWSGSFFIVSNSFLCFNLMFYQRTTLEEIQNAKWLILWKAMSLWLIS